MFLLVECTNASITAVTSRLVLLHQDTNWVMYLLFNSHKSYRIKQHQNHQLRMRLHLQLELTTSIRITFQILTSVWTMTAAGGRAALLQLWDRQLGSTTGRVSILWRRNVSCGVYCRPTWAGAVRGGQWVPGQRPSCTGRRMPVHPSSGWVWPRASAGQGCCFWWLEQMVTRSSSPCLQ